ncbi:MAG: hypothetical protein ABIJ57_16195 [Pseudomonadota bacterium]|nr:LEA type 2 family protein [Pseudomonadota bacterium]MBU4121784.1 LEA type 2 family protein [Pseudomonadota bacterium]
MQKRLILLASVCLLLVAPGLLFGAGKVAKATQKNFKPPVVTLSRVEVAHYWGYWFYGAKVEVTRGKAGNNGAPLDLNFIFDIKNPNPYPVALESLNFTVAFEDFDLNTVGSQEVMWIPAGKTNQLKVSAMFDIWQSFLSLGVTGGFKLQEKGIAVHDQLEKWWTGIPDFAFPVHVKEGSAVFKADKVTGVAAFSGTYPK